MAYGRKAEKAMVIIKGEELTLVTEKATPAFLTVALPRLLTGTMKATWVPDAFITVTPLPANSAPRKRTAATKIRNSGMLSQTETPRKK